MEKYILYDFEATQNTGTHTINLSIAQDFNGREYLHNSIEEFCKGFLNDKFKGYTFIAHNSKGYDGIFVLKWLIDQDIKPYCIYNGAKIMFMEIPKLSIRFIDSLNFLQMPLKSFPKTKKEILEYCQSNIDILKRGIMKLREDFIQLENIDPLRYITIASVCMTIYRSNYMPQETIAIVPEYAKQITLAKCQ